MAATDILRDVSIRLGIATEANYQQKIAAFNRGIFSVTKFIGGLALQVAAFTAIQKGMEAEFGRRSLHANIRRVTTGLALGIMVVNEATYAYNRFRAGLGLVNEQLVDNAKFIIRQADALRVTTDEFQQLGFAFEQYGLTQEDVVTTLERFARGAEDALHPIRGETSRAREEFERLGIAVERLKGKDALGVLEEVAHAFAHAANPDQAKRAIYQLLGEDMSAIFGESLAQRLIPAMAGGAEGITELRRMARDKSLTVDPKLLEQGKDLALQFSILNRQIEVFWQSVGLRLAPAVEILVKLWQDLIVAHDDWINLRISQATEMLTSAIERLDKALRSVDWQGVLAILGGSVIFTTLAGAIAGVAFWMLFWGSIVWTLWQVVVLLDAALGGLILNLLGVQFSLISTVAGWISYIFGVISATLATFAFDTALIPIIATLGTLAVVLGIVVGILLVFVGILAGGLVAAIILVDDFLAYMRGAPSVLGRVMSYLQDITPWIREAGQALWQFGRFVWEAFRLYAQMVWEFWETIGAVLGVKVWDLLSALKPLFVGLAVVLYGMLWAMARVFEAMADSLKWVREHIDGIAEAAASGMALLRASRQMTSPLGPWGMMPAGAAIAASAGTASSMYDYSQRAENSVVINQNIQGGEPGQVEAETRRGVRELTEGTQR